MSLSPAGRPADRGGVRGGGGETPPQPEFLMSLSPAGGGREAGGKKSPKYYYNNKTNNLLMMMMRIFFSFPPKKTVILNTTKILQTLKFTGTLIGYSIRVPANFNVCNIFVVLTLIRIIVFFLGEIETNHHHHQ